MSKRNLSPWTLGIALVWLSGVPGPAYAQTSEALAAEVEAVERAFAQTMADRDHDAFAAFLAEETIFLSGPMVLRGKQAVAQAWAAFFSTPEAPFSWQPETVLVLDSGTLALSTGPVRTPDGAVVSIFTSIWRREPDGAWRIVFDRGTRACPEPGGDASQP